MKKVNIDRKSNKKYRHARFLKKIKIINNTKPRLIVTKTNAHIFAQILDTQNKVLVAVNTLQLKKKGNIESAKEVGSKLAEKALAKGIKEILFDKNGSKFHGQIKALADAAREKGMQF